MSRLKVGMPDRAGRSVRTIALVGAGLLSLGLGAAGVLAVGDSVGGAPSPLAIDRQAAQDATPGTREKSCPDRGGAQALSFLLAPAAQDSTPTTQTEGDLSVADVAELANPAVVTITNLQAIDGSGDRQGVGTGSGFIIDAEGHIVTNSHVVAGAEELSVEFFDGTTATATLVGRDQFQDVAVIKVDPADVDLPGIATLGDSDTVRAGDPIVSIGSALGEFTNTVTEGTVGAVDRSLDTGFYQLPNLIQHDAPIWRGNSGGPILNLRGEVIGMNAAGLGGNERGGPDAAALGFAIEINAVKEIADDLIADGTVERPYLGIEGEPFGDGHAVLEVLPDTPASEAGLEPGDVITAIDGQEIDEGNPLLNLLYEHDPGDTVTLTVDRDGDEETIEVVLGERPAESQ